VKGIDRFRKTVGGRAVAGAVMYNGEDRFEVAGTSIFNPFLHKGLGDVARGLVRHG